jgi:hypothetical protein
MIITYDGKNVIIAQAGMSEIEFLTYPVPLKWAECDFQIIPLLFHLVPFC